MDATIHHDAALAIDGAANAIRQQVRSGSRETRQQKSAWTPDVYMTPVDPSHLLGPIRMSRAGTVPLVSSEEKGLARFLRGAPVSEFEKIEIRLWRAIKPSGSASLKAVQDLARTWVLDAGTDVVLTQHCLRALSQTMRKYTVWVPIAELHIQSPFTIGHVEFRTVTANVLESWIKTDHYSALSPTDKAHVDAHHATLDKEIRGLAAGTFSLYAEPIAAQEAALDAVEEALSFLRLYAAPALVPRLRSHCAPRGQENIEKFHVFLEADGKFASESRGILNYNGRPWVIRDNELEELKQVGLDKLSVLLAATNRNEFQSRVLACLRLYSESTRDSRMTTRLVLMLAALEGLFLKDANEPIAQNLGERLAIMTKHAPEERIAVTQLVRRVYAQRSKFVHHSEHVEVSADIEEFVRLVWFALLDVIANLDVFNTPSVFIEHLDFVKMSGKPFGKSRPAGTHDQRR